MQSFQDPIRDILRRGDHRFDGIQIQVAKDGFEGILLGHIRIPDQARIQRNVVGLESRLVALDAVALRGVMVRSCDEGDAPVMFHQELFGQIVEGTVVVKACEADVHIAGTAFHEHGGNLIVFDAGGKKIRVLGLRGDDKEPAGILTDKLIDLLLLNDRGAVGEGNTDGIVMALQVVGDPFENFRVKLIVNVRQDYTDQVGRGSLQAPGGSIGDVF